jgi:PAS domain S-box-containing protein
MTNTSIFSGPLSLVQLLLIEDNPGDARLIRELLSEAQTIAFQLEHVDRLSAGLARLSEGGIDAVLLDLSLPDSHGLDTLDALRTHQPEVPVLVLTGLDDERTGLKAVRRGAQEYLVKGQTEAALLIRSISYAVERKQAEKSLEQLSHQRELILNTAAEGIYGVDSLGRTTFVNLAAATMLGWAAGELVGQHQHECIHHKRPDGSPYPLEECPVNLSLLDGDVHRVADEVFWRKDGTYFHVEYTSTPILERGEAVGAVVTFDDITQRKQAEDAVRERTQQFNEAQHLARLGSWNWDVRTNLVSWSDELFRLCGVDPQQFGATFEAYLEYVHPDDRERVRSDIEKALHERGSFVHECQFVKPDGTIRYTQARGETVLDKAGSLIGMRGTAQDITERKLADEALRASEERFRAIVEDQTELLVRFLPDGTFTFVNEALCRFYGRSSEELIGKSLFAKVAPDRRELVKNLYASLTRVNPIAITEEPFTTPNADLRWVQWTTRALFNGGDLPIELQAVGLDVTDRKRAEQVLIESEQRYKQMFQGNGSVQLLLDPDTGAIVEANQAASNFYGYSLEELKSMQMSQINVSLGEKELSEVLQRMSVEPLSITSRHKPASGELRDVEGHVGPIDVGGRRLIHAIITDITERTRAQEKLQKSERLYRSLAKNLPDGAVLMFDKDLRFQLAEGSALEVQGFTKEGTEGKTLWEVLPPEHAEHLEPYYREALAGQETNMEFEYFGTFYLVHFVPLKNEQGETYAGMVVTTDITERKRAEEERRSKETAEAANRAKSEFLSRMSHELRTPLNAILGFAQLLDMDPLDAEQHQSLEYIIKAGHHLLGLINEVLDISRIEAGALSLSIEPVPIEDMLQESLDMASSLAAQRNIKLHVHYQEDCKNTHIASDRQRVKQVLLNLIANAIKYNREGGRVSITCERIEARSPHSTLYGADPGGLPGAGRLRIDVGDTGEGISPEKLSRLFTPFDRLGAEQSEVEGTGLGLAVSKRLVEAMGGAISVHSTLGKGSVFSVELPIVESPIERLNRRGTGPLALPEALTQAAYTVLYIEDNLSNLALVERIMAHSPGINLLAAQQGGVGLQLAREHSPDLILLDLHLPDMQGDEVLQRLREDLRTRAIPVVMISADATERQVERLLAAGAASYMTKPLDVKKFLQIVGDILAGLHSSNLGRSSKISVR